MKLYLIRHGHTPSMSHSYFLGATDEPLSAEGREQIIALQEQLADIPLHLVLASPLQRALESANLFCSARPGLEIKVNPKLAERNFGVFEKKAYGELLQTYPELIAEWNADVWNFVPPGGESAENFRIRIANYLFQEILVDIPPSQSVAVFTHSGVIRILLAEAMNFNRDQVWRFSIAPGHMVKLEFDTEDYAFVHW